MVKRKSGIALLSALIAITLSIVPALAAAGDTTADAVYGQGGIFTAGSANNGGISATSIYNPWGLDTDGSGNLYIADFGNNRVLYYPAGNTTATRVYGQGNVFNTNASNKGGISASSLSNPSDIAVDSSGNLYVADFGNNRVLYYPVGSTTATRVYGQNGSFSTGSCNYGGLNENSLCYPLGIAVDSAGNLYVVDTNNNRVLYYPAGSTTATRVYGQGNVFTTNNANKTGVNEYGFAHPVGIALDGSGNLYVSDYNNHRVLFYPSGTTTATRVYGQGGVFTTNTLNKGGLSADSLNGPGHVIVDGSGNLYIVDLENNRVLYYPAGSTTATHVYGQGDVYTTNAYNKGGISANSLSRPTGIALDSSGNLYVADYNNNRALMYSNDAVSPTVAFGTASVPSSNGENLTVGPSTLVVQFSEAVVSGGADGSAEYGGNYLLLGAGSNGVIDTPLTSTAICDSDHIGIAGDDVWIRFDSLVYNGTSLTVTATVESVYAPLANGTYRLYLCGAASIDDLAGNPLNGGSNSAINFTVGLAAANAIPSTGFAPDQMTVLPEQTVSYTASDLWLEIPKLGVQMDIVGVPQVDGEWDVSWLGNDAGWLDGSAFPTWAGNSVLTGHVWNADNTAGPFRYINTLWYGDQVIIHAWGVDYVYEVRSVTQVGPGSTAAMLKHEELPWVTLVTCRGYDSVTGDYKYRVLVRAVLVEVK